MEDQNITQPRSRKTDGFTITETDAIHTAEGVLAQ
jgi:hypothetical protein